MAHVPVLLHEAIEGLAIEPTDIVVDATLGAGGHSSEIARRYPTVTIVGFDLDQNALTMANDTVTSAGGTLVPIHANFRQMKDQLAEADIHEVNRVLFDLGVSSMEFGPSGRGFSFKYDEPLLMTLATHIEEDTLTADTIVNSYTEEDLANVIYQYGEEKFSRRIAKAICQARRKERIRTTFALAEIVAQAVPAFYRNGRLNPATKTFQALRIAVNDELGALEEGVRSAWSILAPKGRIAVITFHSLEDRIVKNIFKEYATEGGIRITKKPVVPTREEIISNPRSRSAKLRIIEKI